MRQLIKMQSSLESLQEFFNTWQEIRNTEDKTTGADNIPQLLGKFSAHHHKGKQATPASSSTPKAIDPQRLEYFFTAIEKPLQASRHSAIAFDPWRVIALGRNEVNVVKILSWLLNPYGSHGYGPALQQGLLAYVNRHLPFFPVAAQKRCQVRTEINLNGECENRVDIEMDSDDFYLIIEAKIDALEQPRQVERYCDRARQRAWQLGCPWAVVYLTPRGKKPSHEEENLICLSWNQLSRILRESMKQHAKHRTTDLTNLQGNAEFFIKTYLNHIRSL